MWIEGEILYAAQDGPVGVGQLHIIDISNPAMPRPLARFSDPQGFIHDVLVRDGLAFLSFWDAGLIILDVGNGIAGGSPAAPVEVSRIALGGQTHNAWYWPARGLVFVGEEQFAGDTGPRAPGILHVVDVSDLRRPQEVATFSTPLNRDPPHNFWVDESREVLYVAWYGEGIVVLDVSGTLQGGPSAGESHARPGLSFRGRGPTLLDGNPGLGSPTAQRASLDLGPEQRDRVASADILRRPGEPPTSSRSIASGCRGSLPGLPILGNGRVSGVLAATGGRPYGNARYHPLQRRSHLEQRVRTETLSQLPP